MPFGVIILPSSIHVINMSKIMETNLHTKTLVVIHVTSYELPSIRVARRI